jgi:hypothetical protein
MKHKLTFFRINCVENSCLVLSHHRVALWAPSPNEQLAPYPGLLIPPLPAPERYDLSHKIII